MKTTNLLTPLNIGDQVLLNGLALRQNWPLRTIIEAYPSGDGIARTFDVRLNDGTETTRPTQRLLSLEGTWT